MNDYEALLTEVKVKIRTAQVKSVLAVNSELIKLYWEIGKLITEKQESAGWGDSIVEKIAFDVRKEFPTIKGFSRSNIFAMRQFYLAYSSEEKNVQQLVGQIPWGHNLLLINKIKNPMIRRWYINQAIEFGWSRGILEHQIETDLYKRQTKKEKTNNFALTLDSTQSELVQQTIKDPYIFDFLTIGKNAKEKDLQNELMDKIKNFLLELGVGFAFMGCEYHLEVSSKDFYVDMLFYHHKLRCLFAIELKTEDFKPEFAGKMNFYLSALDATIKHKDDNASVGLILCKGKNKIIAEYSLKDIKKPIGISEYKLTRELTKNYQKNLPSVEKLEKLIGD